MTEPAITPELVAKHNLTPEEYAHAKENAGIIGSIFATLKVRTVAVAA